MSDFNVNCPVLDITPPLEHECGTQKPLSFSGAGTFEDNQTFYLQYNKLENLRTVYITINPTVSKLLKFTFSKDTFNGTNLKVRVKQILGNTIVIVGEFDLGTLSSEVSF